MTRGVADSALLSQPLHSSDRSPQQIIASAREVQSRHQGQLPMWSTVVMCAASALLLWASFPPLNFSPLAWVALVPLLSLARIRQPARRIWLATWLGGIFFYVPVLQWLRLGDPTMYLAWMALASYLAVTFPMVVGVCRVALLRWSIPLIVAAPVAWVGLEFVKAHLFTGFAWYFLGHTQYRWLDLIQISDLVGAYGVSFVMVAVSASIAGLIPEWCFIRLKLAMPQLPDAHSDAFPAAPLSPVVTTTSRPVWLAAALFAATLAYGQIRRGEAEFTPGPRVALIQGNFVASLRIPPEDYGSQYLTHMKLTAMAVREQPDVIVWPESMFRWPLTSIPAGLSDDELQQLAPHVPPAFWRDETVRETLVTESRKTGAALIYGIECVDLHKPSESRTAAIQQCNSAVFVRPDTGLSGRYDKMHLVPFGEYLPFKETLPWLQQLTPYPPDFGLHAGDQAALFQHQSWRMMPLICFEDTVPHLVRNLVNSGTNSESGEQVDLLVNLSNDGWFHGSSGLDQHLITAAFRAVECRVPMVRAVNTGVSAIIDGDGAIGDPDVFIDGDQQQRTFRDARTGRWNKQLNAAIISTIPLDSRTSLYTRFGDWFAGGCLGLTLFTGLSHFLPRRMRLTN